MISTIVISSIFAILAVICFYFSFKNQSIDSFLWGIMFCFGVGIPWIIHHEHQEELTNKETCTVLGVVEDVICTSGRTAGRHSYGYSTCRVRLNDGSKHNLDAHLMALKGDKISYCSNSIKRFEFKNHYVVE